MTAQGHKIGPSPMSFYDTLLLNTLLEWDGSGRHEGLSAYCRKRCLNLALATFLETGFLVNLEQHIEM